MKHKICEQLEPIIVEEYINGLSANAISLKYNVSLSSVMHRLRKNNVEVRSIGENVKAVKKTKFIPEIGKKFGQWTVISEVTKAGNYLLNSNKSRQIYWKVRCDCGRESWRCAATLVENRTNSCKSCSKKDSYKDTFTQSYFNKIVTRAKIANYEFDLEYEDLYDKFIDQNGKCALSGVDIKIKTTFKEGKQTASLDRIDSSRGYIKHNIQWVHKDVNFMKYTLGECKFIEYCKKIAENCENKCG